MSKYNQIDIDCIIDTADRLHVRISERFPESGLRQVCSQLTEITHKTRARNEAIGQPIIWVRVVAVVLSLLIVGALILGFLFARSAVETPGAFELVQILEAAINDIVLIGAAIFFLVTIEVRIKRKKALNAIHELRSLAHIIDMHQLTKDPMHVTGTVVNTEHSPVRTMTSFELSWYLDYCSEMLSVIGKIAAIYGQNFSDSVALAAVNEIENLTTSLSSKIWQKVVLLADSAGPARAALPAVDTSPASPPQPSPQPAPPSPSAESPQ